ncbi:transposase [Kribbella sp. NPDC002412]
MAVEELADLVAVDAKLKAIKNELRTAVNHRGSHLTELFGIGPAGAARILADVGDVARFPDRNHFASWTGTAPLDASSGEQIRHRLSRAGNRRLNHVLHIAAIVQIRHDTAGRACYRRKLADGKTPMEALRCLKRRLSDAIYRQLVNDTTQTATTGEASPGGHSGATSQSSAADLYTPVIGSSDQPLPGPAATTLPPPTAHAKPRPAPGSPPHAPTRRSGQGGAPHRTNDLDGDKRRRILNEPRPAT